MLGLLQNKNQKTNNNKKEKGHVLFPMRKRKHLAEFWKNGSKVGGPGRRNETEAMGSEGAGSPSLGRSPARHEA